MKTNVWTLCAVASIALLAACQKRKEEPAGDVPDPAEVAVGERLFLETRFAQFFAANAGGLLNAPLAPGDPTMDETVSVTENLPGPFVGRSMNCRACHLVDEHRDAPGGGVRTYADFARRSPIPARADGKTVAVRNSPTLVNSSIARGTTPFFFHFDAEFPTLEDLVRGTLTGRNFGWLPGEEAAAVANLAAVIRGDNGTSDIAAGFPYAVILGGVDPRIPPELVLPPAFRIDVATATDQQLFDAVATLIAAYVDSLRFVQDANGEFNGSPYDRFLAKNGLPRVPNPGESDLDYARRLRGLIAGLASPVFVTSSDGAFALHNQEFVFGPKQLDGLTIFLAEPAAATPGLPSGPEIAAGRIGNCIACHAPPNLTDQLFHNIGAAQSEYDGIHGAGQFALLSIPTFAARTANDLPPTAATPGASGRFRDVPLLADPTRTDLGLWNIFGNPAVPGPQAGLAALFGATANATLAATVARFKTPTLRDLGQTAPYFHTGQKDSLESVLQHYVAFSGQARAATVVNADPELGRIAIRADDVEALRAFLRSLNEDYE